MLEIDINIDGEKICFVTAGLDIDHFNFMLYFANGSDARVNLLKDDYLNPNWNAFYSAEGKILYMTKDATLEILRKFHFLLDHEDLFISIAENLRSIYLANASPDAWSFADFYSFISQTIGQNDRRSALINNEKL